LPTVNVVNQDNEGKVALRRVWHDMRQFITKLAKGVKEVATVKNGAYN